MAYLGRRSGKAGLTTADIPDNSITAAKIVVDTITAGDLAANSVDSSELVNGSVDLSHMSANSVDSNQYVDGSIDTIHIGASQITNALMADNAIDSAEIVAGAIDTAHIAADNIVGSIIADNTIDSEHYVAGSIDNEHLADDAVGSDELANNVVISTSGSITTTGGLTVDGATVFNEASADVDFRIEGNGEANLFCADASTDCVGIGTAAPNARLHIKEPASGVMTAMHLERTGQMNHYIGYDTANKLIIGENVDMVSSVRLGIDPSGNVGIGTASPTAKLHVDGHTTLKGFIKFEASSDGAHTGYIGDGANMGGGGGTNDLTLRSADAMYFFHSGGTAGMVMDTDGNVGINTVGDSATRFSVRNNTNAAGFSAIFRGGTNSLTTSNDWNMIGFGYAGADAGYVNAGIGHIYTAANGNNDMIFCVKSGGFANVTNSDTKMTIHASGSIGATSGTNIYNASDKRLKQNITNLAGSLSKIEQMQGVSFNWKTDFCPVENDKTLYGLIAQDLQLIDTVLVDSFSDGQPIKFGELDNEEIVEEPLRVNEKFIIPMLVEAVKELSAKVTALESA